MKIILGRSILLILKVVGGIIAVAAVSFGILLLFITITEYRPQDKEPAEIIGEAALTKESVELAKPIDIVSWNIGYCGLGAGQDFFMDGGTMVRPSDKKEVEENLAGVIETLKRYPSDFYFIQEMDKSSKRSYYIDQTAALAESLGTALTYTYNFKASYVPYPIPPIGKVASGVGLFTRYPFTDAYRFALPVPFKWPVSTVNLKRCMLITRFPLESGRELVTAVLHLEAYDEGEGKIAQTKAVVDFIRAEYEAGNYVIAGGDFNQIFPGSRSLYPLYDGLWAPGVMDGGLLPEGWHFAVDDRVPSCRLNNAPYRSALSDENIRKKWPYYVIDGFIVSPNISIMSVETLDESFRYADHNPVKLRVTLNP
ncbi:endonuclease/exonuclease/phosphatase family protein [uncultured Treponema sp.]|uniref:endonuclease/exonuclease/phosphatase family protein n=1 Tax=uncultured Treponema sp. TaxID=162155 RepID=UPI0028E9B1AB|nr:endonuclease/exonuclease/phosphatase family protein [uncultured Treponema sp.]